MWASAPIAVTSHCFLHASGPGIVCVQELHSALKRVQNELAKYSHVNKKALDQYVNFTEQRENLDRRRQEIEESGGSVCYGLAGPCRCQGTWSHVRLGMLLVMGPRLSAPRCR